MEVLSVKSYNGTGAELAAVFEIQVSVDARLQARQ